MRKNYWKYLLLVFAGLIILGGTFSTGFLIGQTASLIGVETPVLEVASTDPQIPEQQDEEVDLEELFEPFWEAWRIVEDQYVEQPVDREEMMRGAISGMMESLEDPHSSYMDPVMFQQQNAPLQGEYEGIGAWVDTSGDVLTIISPMPESPAEEAGLQPEDEVVAVDGENVVGMDGNLVLRRILGPAGTDVTLTIFRPETEETFDVTITRAKIDVPSVTSEMLEENIAYIQLVNFGDQTHEDLREHLKDLLAQDPDGLILDLRNNGGGYLNTAIDITSEFVNQSPLMYEVFGDGREITYDARSTGLATEIPLVVLINGGSASASEITAGAIQDYDRGVLVGQQSFGKGSVQNWIPLQNDQGAVRVTIARWLTPDKRQISEVGLTPDYVVEITEEDMEAGVDPQLNKAIELLSSD